MRMTVKDGVKRRYLLVYAECRSVVLLGHHPLAVLETTMRMTVEEDKRWIMGAGLAFLALFEESRCLGGILIGR